MKINKSLRLLLITSVLITLSGCKEAAISHISERQANEVVALLQRYNINADKKKGEKNTFIVTVDHSQLRHAIVLMNENHLPSKDDVEIDQFFPTDALVASPRAEKARLISAIEQKLQQSLTRLNPVIDARVHLSYPLDDDKRPGNKSEKRVSVMIIHHPIDEPTIFSNKVRLLILNSFTDVSLENITVVLFPAEERVNPQP